MAITAKQLQKLQRQYAAAMERTEQLRQARNAAILEALAEGKTQTWIAETIGIAQTRISQVATSRGSSGRLPSARP